MCAIAICHIDPFAANTSPKNSSRLMPITISGVTIGSRISVSIAPAPRRCCSRASPSPSSVPSVVVTTTEIAATWIVTQQRVEQLVVLEQRRVPVAA